MSVVKGTDNAKEHFGTESKWFIYTIGVKASSFSASNALDRVRDVVAEMGTVSDAELYSPAENLGKAEDVRAWRPEIPKGRDSATIAGVMEARQRPGTITTPTHMIVVKIESGIAAAFVNKFIEQKNPSVEELVVSPEYNLAQNYALRNVQRIAAEIGGALAPTKPITTVISVLPDTAAVRSGTFAPPLLAQPRYTTPTNFIAATPMPDNAGVRYTAHFDTTDSQEAMQFLDMHKGFVVSHKPVAGCVQCVSLNVVRDSPEENATFMGVTASSSNRDNARLAIQSRFVTLNGAAPSTRSRVLWEREGVDSVDTSSAVLFLTPMAVAINGVEAKKALDK